MTGIFLGDTAPSKIFIGDTEVSKVFVGDTQVRPTSRLPSAYQEVEYIETTGTQWIDTGLYVDSNIQMETKIEQTVSTQEIPVFGSTQGDWSKADQYYCLIPYKNQWYWGINNSGGHGGSYSSSDIGTQYTIVFNNSNSQCVVNNIQLGSTSGAKLYSQSYTLGISVRRGQNEDRIFGKFKYFYFKIYDKANSQYVIDLVPCYRKLDNVIGMYDLVNDQFYTNSGTGTFTKGPDVN